MTPEQKEYIRNWLDRANEDVSVIQALAKDNIEFYTSSICFHCQQAVEKYLKAFLAYKNIDFPKSHDVDYLLNKCLLVDNNSFKDFEFKNLSDFGVDIRYPDDFFVPTVSETKNYIEIII